MSALLLRYGVTNPTSYSTAFPLTENPISEGGRWRVGGVTGFYRSPQTTPGLCFGNGTSADFDDCLGQLQTPFLNANYSISVVIHKTGGYTAPDSHEVGIYGRLIIGASLVRGYEVLIGFTSGEFQVVKWLGISQASDNFTVMSTSGTPAAVNDGDVFRADFIGNVITVYRNGSLFNTTTDSSSPWLDGNPGMGFFIRPGGTPSSYCTTSWAVNGL